MAKQITGPGDIRLQTTKAFPAAAANNQSDGLAIGGGAEYARRGGLLILRIPANSTLVDDKSITAKIQHSADDGDVDDYADVACLGAVAVTGMDANGTPVDGVPGAYEVLTNGDVLITWPCPHGLKEWVRAHVAVEADGGNLTGIEYAFSYAPIA